MWGSSVECLLVNPSEPGFNPPLSPYHRLRIREPVMKSRLCKKRPGPCFTYRLEQFTLPVDPTDKHKVKSLLPNVAGGPRHLSDVYRAAAGPFAV